MTRAAPVTGVTAWRLATTSSLVTPAARASGTVCWNEDEPGSTAMVAATRTSAAVRSSSTEAANELRFTAIFSRSALS
jgi:hypothetical protein